MEKNRLFTFGCSHTQYRWPSWANILGLSFKEFYNLGRPGSGIFYMVYQFVYANEHFKFRRDDTLIFMLSDEARIDFVKENDWLVAGLAFNSKHIFGEKLFEHYTITHAIESTYIFLYFLKKELESIGCNYEIIYAFTPVIHESDEIISDNLKSIWNKKFNLTSNKIKSLTEFAKQDDIRDSSYSFYRDRNTLVGGKILPVYYNDSHFTVLTHLMYVKKYLSKYYDDVNDSIVKDWHQKVPVDKHDSNVINMFYNTINKNKVEFINGVMTKIHLKKEKLL
jgi:ACT domain-containing protein